MYRKQVIYSYLHLSIGQCGGWWNHKEIYKQVGRTKIGTLLIFLGRANKAQLERRKLVCLLRTWVSVRIQTNVFAMLNTPNFIWVKK